MLSDLYSIYPTIDNTLPWAEDRRLIPLIEEYNIPFSKHTIENKDLYSNIFTNIIETFKEEKFPLYKDYRKDFRRLSKKVTHDLICSFLNDFDDSLLNLYQNLIKEGKIFTYGHKSQFSVIYTISSLNDNLILSTNGAANDIYTSSVIVHELGHLFENNLYNTTGNSHLIEHANRYPFYEVVSRFLEYSYLNYLKKNNIYKEQVDMAIRKYYIDLFINAYHISILYQLDKILIDEENYVEIEEQQA